jgi:hypothetical protein
MYRGKTQVLYGYLPRKTFDYEDEPYIFMVKDVVSQPVNKENTDIFYITNNCPLPMPRLATQGYLVYRTRQN